MGWKSAGNSTVRRMAAAAAELGPEVEQLHRAEEAGPGDEEEEHSLERLEMLRVIGTGTFARVCLARARGSNKHYALKILTMATVIKLKQVRTTIYQTESSKC